MSFRAQREGLRRASFGDPLGRRRRARRRAKPEPRTPVQCGATL